MSGICIITIFIAKVLGSKETYQDLWGTRQPYPTFAAT